MKPIVTAKLPKVIGSYSLREALGESSLYADKGARQPDFGRVLTHYEVASRLAALRAWPIKHQEFGKLGQRPSSLERRESGAHGAKVEGCIPPSAEGELNHRPTNILDAET